MQRHKLTERQWQLVKPHTLGKSGTAGGTGKDNRLFVNAVLWRVRTGVPECFGKWNSIARRFRRWAKAGPGTRCLPSSRSPIGNGSCWIRPPSRPTRPPRAKKARRHSNASSAAAAASRPRFTPSSTHSTTASTST